MEKREKFGKKSSLNGNTNLDRLIQDLKLEEMPDIKLERVYKFLLSCEKKN